MALLASVFPRHKFTLRNGHSRQSELLDLREEVVGRLNDEREQKLLWALQQVVAETKRFNYACKRPEQEELTQIVNRIQYLVNMGDIPKARKTLVGTPIGVSRVLDNWRKALAPPVAGSIDEATGRNTKVESDWLEQNYERYMGQWVALLGSDLLGHHEDRSELDDALSKKNKLDGALLVEIKEDQSWAI